MYIAWHTDTWLARPQRQARIEELSAIIDLLDAEFPDAVTMPDDLALQYHEIATELLRLNRVHRAEVDLLYFAHEYFGVDYNAGNDGNWIPAGNAPTTAPDFHREICATMDHVSHKKRNDKVAVAAPRSHAKSSFLSKAYPIREVVYRLRSYVIIISETPAVSSANMEWISEQLKSNEKLRNDFGSLLSPKDQANIKDNSEEFIAWYEDASGRKRQIALVQAASTGQRLRGRNWNGNRPDLIICDDLEDGNTNAATAEQRKKLREWFASVVMPLGDPKGEKTALVYMGTTVHHDALLMRILHQRSDFTTSIYRAIKSYPTNGELWEQCRQIYVNRDDPDRAANAESFYERNKRKLLEGVNVLWPDVQPIFKLMLWKWNNGSKAFNTEYMNNPIDEESQVFSPSGFTYWTDKNELVPHEIRNSTQYDVSMGVDVAMGKQRGDYSAITVIARHKLTGVEYVIDSYGERVKPNVLIDEVVKRVVLYEPHVIGAEANAAQEFFVDQLKEALEAAGYPAHTRVKKIYSRSNKELRIEAMIPDIEAGKLRFSRAHALLLEQFERYGSGDHDDLPDSLEMAKAVLKKVAKSLQNKPSWL